MEGKQIKRDLKDLSTNHNMWTLFLDPHSNKQTFKNV